MRWWVVALVACGRTPEQVSAVSSEKVASAPEKPAPEKPAVSAQPEPSTEPVASVSATAAKPKTLSSAEHDALAKALDALDMKPLGSLGGKSKPDDSLPTTTVKASAGEVSTGAAVSGPPGADAVIARNRWRFKACYNKQLALDPGAAGTIKVSVSTNADGEVTSATQVSSTAPAMLSACTTTAFKSMKFDPAAAAKFTVPVVFSPKQ